MTFIWWLTVAILGLAVVYPSIILIINSFKTKSGYSFENYLYVFSNEYILQSMLNSAKVVICSTLFSTVIGVFLAWIVIRTNVPGKKYWQRLLTIPYFIPPFIGAIAWTFLLGPIGYFNKFLAVIMGTMRGPINVYSIGGMIFVLSLYRYAVPFMVVVPAMQKISASVEEAARMSGASPWRTLRDITLPLITPSILGAALLTFMFILADFGVSVILGAPNQIRLMTTQIFYLVSQPGMENNLQIASACSIVLSLFGLIGLFVYNRVLKSNKYVVVSGKSAPIEPTKLGKTKWVLFAFLLLFFLITTCAPIIATFIASITKVWGLPFDIKNITFTNFSKLLQIQNIRRALKNSMFLSLTSAVIITILTFVIGYIAIRGGVRGIRGVGLMQTMVTLPYAVPGTIIALAMVLAFSQPLPVVGWKLYNTIWILLIAYVARFLNLGYNNITGAISQIDTSLEEAARMSGATHFKAISDVMLPLLRSSFIGSFLLVVAPTLSEITLSGLLWSVGNETIGVIVYAAKEEGRVLLTASMAIVLMIMVVLMNLFMQSISEKKSVWNSRVNKVK